MAKNQHEQVAYRVGLAEVASAVKPVLSATFRSGAASLLLFNICFLAGLVAFLKIMGPDALEVFYKSILTRVFEESGADFIFGLILSLVVSVALVLLIAAVSASSFVLCASVLLIPLVLAHRALFGASSDPREHLSLKKLLLRSALRAVVVSCIFSIVAGLAFRMAGSFIDLPLAGVLAPWGVYWLAAFILGALPWHMLTAETLGDGVNASARTFREQWPAMLVFSALAAMALAAATGLRIALAELIEGGVGEIVQWLPTLGWFLLVWVGYVSLMAAIEFVERDAQNGVV